MPNIKGISNNKGDITITKIDDKTLSLLRTDLSKLSADVNTGVLTKNNTAFDVYTHCYEDLTKKNTKRTAVCVCKKGYVPQKNWWVQEAIPKEVIKVG